MIIDNNSILRRIHLIVCLLFSSSSLYAQDVKSLNYIDSLIAKAEALNQIHLDSSIAIAEHALNLAVKLKVKDREAQALDRLGFYMDRKGTYEKGITYYKQSLKIKLTEGIKSAGWTMSEIGFCYNQLGKVDEALKYFQMGLEFAKKNKVEKDVGLGMFRIGEQFQRMGNLQNAITYYEESIKIGEKLNDLFIVAQCLSSFTNIYRTIGNMDRSLEYGKRFIEVANTFGDKRLIVDAYSQNGFTYQTSKNYEKAKEYFLTSLQISQKMDHPRGIFSSYIQLGNLYLELNLLKDALNNYKKAYDIALKIETLVMQANSLNKMAQIHLTEKDFKQASSLASSSFEIAQKIKNPYQVRFASEILWKTYREMKDYSRALKFHEIFETIKDSLSTFNIEKTLLEKEMNFKFTRDSLRFENEKQITKKEQAIAKMELQRQKQLNAIFIAGLVLVLFFAGVFLTQRNKIKAGKKLSDELLLNILPEEVADELKSKGSAEAKQFEEVTVMFTDFKGFTQISEKLSPTELVDKIHTCFKTFDHIIAKHNIEKIKTIGDSYMCAGGLPLTNTTNAVDVVLAAIEIQQFMRDYSNQSEKSGKESFEIRIGIHTGPVVAGIVGVKKFAYDIWGDTVNTASRMESSGEAGKINISGSTYELVKNKFNCIHRGKIQAKNKGEIEMYFVETLS